MHPVDHRISRSRSLCPESLRAVDQKERDDLAKSPVALKSGLRHPVPCPRRR